MARSADIPDPTEAELAILHVLWRRGASSVREVWHELGEKTGYTTALKLLQIMFEKGLVRRDERAVTHRYEAAVTKDQTQDRLLRRLLQKAFEGSASQLVLRALSSKAISPEELKTIRRLLAEEERKSP
jgi:BlaI family penicillinase repressor